MKSDKHTNASNRNADPEAVKAAVAHLRESVAKKLRAKAEAAVRIVTEASSSKACGNKLRIKHFFSEYLSKVSPKERLEYLMRKGELGGGLPKFWLPKEPPAESGSSPATLMNWWCNQCLPDKRHFGEVKSSDQDKADPARGRLRLENITCVTVDLLTAMTLPSVRKVLLADAAWVVVPTWVGLDKWTTTRIHDAMWFADPFFYLPLYKSRETVDVSSGTTSPRTMPDIYLSAFGELLSRLRLSAKDDSAYALIRRELAHLGALLMDTVLPKADKQVRGEQLLGAEMLLARFATDSVDSLLACKAPFEALSEMGGLAHLKMREKGAVVDAIKSLCPEPTSSANRKRNSTLHKLVYADGQKEIPLDDCQFGLYYGLSHVKEHSPALLARARYYHDKRRALTRPLDGTDEDGKTAFGNQARFSEDLRTLRVFLTKPSKGNGDCLSEEPIVIPGLWRGVSPKDCREFNSPVFKPSMSELPDDNRKSSSGQRNSDSDSEFSGLPDGGLAIHEDCNNDSDGDDDASKSRVTMVQLESASVLADSPWDTWVAGRVEGVMTAKKVTAADFWRNIDDIIEDNGSINAWNDLGKDGQEVACELFRKLPFWLTDFGLLAMPSPQVRVPEPLPKPEPMKPVKRTPTTLRPAAPLLPALYVSSANSEGFARAMQPLFEILEGFRRESRTDLQTLINQFKLYWWKCLEMYRYDSDGFRDALVERLRRIGIMEVKDRNDLQQWIVSTGCEQQLRWAERCAEYLTETIEEISDVRLGDAIQIAAKAFFMDSPFNQSGVNDGKKSPRAVGSAAAQEGNAKV